MNTVIMQPSINIDDGKVILKSKNFHLGNLRVFQIAVLGYYLQSDLILKVNSLKIRKNLLKKFQTKEIKSYSFPLKKDLQNLKTFRDIFQMKDIFFIIKLFYMNFKIYNSAFKKYLIS